MHSQQYLEGAYQSMHPVPASKRLISKPCVFNWVTVAQVGSVDGSVTTHDAERRLVVACIHHVHHDGCRVRSRSLSFKSARLLKGMRVKASRPSRISERPGGPCWSSKDMESGPRRYLLTNGSRSVCSALIFLNGIETDAITIPRSCRRVNTAQWKLGVLFCRRTLARSPSIRVQASVNSVIRSRCRPARFRD